MNTKRFGIFIIAPVILLSMLIAGCGPSAEEQAATFAALTAAAATDTPTPTPTDTPTPTVTPVPYDLSLIVTGEEDVAIVGAHVVLEEVGDEAGIQITDEVGQASWFDLPGETVSLSISAQGYFPVEMTESVKRGINQMTVSLERDPHGLLPSQACGPGEKLLYIEDFQDGEAQGWEKFKLRVGGWGLGPHPDSLGNIVAMYNGRQWSDAGLSAGSFDNAVWRIQFMTDSKGILSFHWRHKEGAGFSAYSALFESGSLLVIRNNWPISNPALLNTDLNLTRATWHQLEMSTFEGRLETWLDGRRLLVYEDPEPLPSGTIKIWFESSPDVESVIYFDDISVCELTAPYVPMPTPES